MVPVDECMPSRRCRCLIVRTCAIMSIISLLYYTCLQKDVFAQNASAPSETNFVLAAVRRIQSTLPLSYGLRKRKTVLLWTTYFGEKDWLPSTEQLNCRVRECDVSSSRSLLNESSAVVMHWRDVNPADLPKCSDPSGKNCPRLVLFNNEAPPHTPIEKLVVLEKKIHWAATYRRDSDIFAPYGKIEKRATEYSLPDMKPDRRLLCWLVSNCNTPSQRESYVMKLKEYIPVDIYGKCGYQSCPEERRDDCYKWLSQRCKFYLSFENSICKDYVTEKLYLALSTDMVPIVMGGSDYSRYLPKHSYIGVTDFSSPKSLAEYLVKLSQDSKAYLSYFEWKKEYVVADGAYKWLCTLCEKLHDDQSQNVKPRKDVVSWWFMDSKCQSWRTLYGDDETTEADSFQQDF